VGEVRCSSMLHLSLGHSVKIGPWQRLLAPKQLTHTASHHGGIDHSFQTMTFKEFA
jgi:hypothetical protein